MPYKVTPKPRDEADALDIPGEKHTHHRVKMPHGGVIPKEGVIIASLDAHYLRQMLRGEVDIHELDAEGKEGRKLPTAAEEVQLKNEADAKKAADDKAAAAKKAAPEAHPEADHVN